VERALKNLKDVRIYTCNFVKRVTLEDHCIALKFFRENLHNSHKATAPDNYLETLCRLLPLSPFAMLKRLQNLVFPVFS